MSGKFLVQNSPMTLRPEGEDDLAPPEADGRDCPAGGGLPRFVRRLLRVLGILVVLATGSFLMSQHLLPWVVALPEAAVAAAAGPGPAPAEEDRKLVVCFGYADLAGGVVTLHPSQPGRVDEIPVEENQDVPGGATLLRLDDRAARLRVEEARGVLDESLARLAKAEKGPEKYRAELARQKAAVEVARRRTTAAEHSLAARQERQRVEGIGRSKEDPVTGAYVASSAERVKEMEEAERLERETLRSLELDDPVTEVSLAEAEVVTMRARLRQAEQVLDDHTLKAPEAGRVLRIFVTRGELIGAQPKPGAIQFCPARPRVIRAEVDQAFALRVKAGQPALIEDDGHAGSTWRGKVSRIADWYTHRRLVAEEQLQMKDVRTLECIVAVDPGQAPLRIGQRVRVTISRPEP
jgi:multidrug resistance efflux pump